MFQEEGSLIVFIILSTLIVCIILLLLWILWHASTFLINNINININNNNIISWPDEYINNQVTLFSNENATVREEMQMVVFDIESQFRR